MGDREFVTAEASAPSEDKTRLKRAEARHAWRTSAERKGLVRNLWLIAVALVPFVLGGAFYCKLFVLQPTNANYLAYIGIGALAWFMLCAYPGVALTYVGARRAFHDRKLLEQEHAELVQAESEIASGSTDFQSLWTVTQRRIDYYHRIATTQAEQSFLYGQIAAGAGFLIILISVIIAAAAHSTAASIGAAISGVSGGGLGAFIGATFMRSQDTASTQLREYFRQPLDFSKYLAAERLLEQLNKNERPAAIQHMIEAIVSPSASANSSSRRERRS
jgi:hypothetical protein